MKKLFLFFYCMLSVFPSLGQQVDFTRNSPRIGDVIVKQCTDFFVSVCDGQQALWDFSNILTTGKKEQTIFFLSKDSVLCSASSRGVIRFSLSEDSLLMLGYESPLIYMDYSKPQLQTIFPLSYGSRAERTYEGSGIYCKKDLIRQRGVVIQEVDGEGSIINAQGDTLNNVVKVHTILTSSLCMFSPIDTLSMDSMRTRHEVIDRNQWFVLGYRYPLYETSTTTYYDGLEQISNIKQAYVYNPEEQGNAPDKVNDDILERMQDGNNVDDVLIEYNFSKTDYLVTLDIIPQYDVTITTFLYSSRAMVYGKRSQMVSAGQSHQIMYDISSLPRGEYVLYVNVNGQVISEKFTK